MSQPTNYHDPAIARSWAMEQRDIVLAYLAKEPGERGQLGTSPAWMLAPYWAIWAIESRSNPGSVGWWAISGDCPTDYIGSKGLSNPRDAVNALGTEWLEHAAHMSAGVQPHEVTFGDGSHHRELAEPLARRAKLLLMWAADDSMWL